MPSYRIKPLLWLVRDAAGVRFHVQSDDYFGTAATVLSLLRQKIQTSGLPETARLVATCRALEDDLLLLQADYQISPRTRKKNIRPKGRLISQCSNIKMTRKAVKIGPASASRRPRQRSKK